MVTWFLSGGGRPFPLVLQYGAHLIPLSGPEELKEFDLPLARGLQVRISCSTGWRRCGGGRDGDARNGGSEV